jgi:hypothetical protein
MVGRRVFGVVLDTTELGDLLPLVGAEYSSGAETAAETGEPHAQPKPNCVQSFTYVLGVARRPLGEHHVIAQPARYDFFRSAQPYSLHIEVHGGEIYGEESGWLSYKVFETMPGTKGGLWTYRRFIDSAQFGAKYPTELSIFNWPGNNYRESSIIDRPAAAVAAALQDAKRASLGFLHWVQTKAPAEGDRLGAPELSLQPDITDTTDGVAKFSLYPRGAAYQGLAYHRRAGRVSPFPERADRRPLWGFGWRRLVPDRYSPCRPGGCISCSTRPFQIPLGALIPVPLRNLIATAKNIGTTHITNGCYRLHPVEWNIGEAAGALAAFCLGQGETPAIVHGTPELCSAFQRSLVAEGVPLDWAVHMQG